MAKRRIHPLIPIVILIIVLLFVAWSFKRGEKYTPGDTKFYESELPSATDAIIIEPGLFEKNKKYSTPNGEYYLLFRDDGNLIWADKNNEVKWNFGTEGAGEDATARFLKNGQICVAGKILSKCSESTNPAVPEGQYLLVLKNNGELYIDSGAGMPERFNFHEPR